jgi:hypothetical protein
MQDCGGGGQGGGGGEGMQRGGPGRRAGGNSISFNRSAIVVKQHLQRAHP